MSTGNPLADYFAGMAARLDGVTFAEATEDARQTMAQVKKIGYRVPISADLAMDYGLIPDTRPASPPLSRRVRFRWWRQERVSSLRYRLASWIAGFDVLDRD